jgi:hypothetical protein
MQASLVSAQLAVLFVNNGGILATIVGVTGLTVTIHRVRKQEKNKVIARNETAEKTTLVSLGLGRIQK